MPSIEVWSVKILQLQTIHSNSLGRVHNWLEILLQDYLNKNEKCRLERSGLSFNCELQHEVEVFPNYGVTQRSNTRLGYSRVAKWLREGHMMLEYSWIEKWLRDGDSELIDLKVGGTLRRLYSFIVKLLCILERCTWSNIWPTQVQRSQSQIAPRNSSWRTLLCTNQTLRWSLRSDKASDLLGLTQDKTLLTYWTLFLLTRHTLVNLVIFSFICDIPNKLQKSLFIGLC